METEVRGWEQTCVLQLQQTKESYLHYTENSDETTQETHTHKQTTIEKVAENLNRPLMERQMANATGIQSSTPQAIMEMK